MTRPHPPLWVLVLAICGGLEGATDVTTTTADPSPLTTTDFRQTFTADSYTSTPDSSTQSTADSFTQSTADSFTQPTADSYTSIPDSSTQSTADSFTQSTADSFTQSIADSYTSIPDSSTQSTADSFTQSTANSYTSIPDSSTQSTADSFTQSTADSYTSIPDSSTQSTADSFTQSTADSFTQSTADSYTSIPDSFTQSTDDSFTQSTADSYTSIPDSFTQSTADSFTQSTADSYTSIPDSSTQSTADSFTQSTADSYTSIPDSFTQSTADSFTQSTADSFTQSTADSYTSIPDSFTQSTDDSFTQSTADSYTSIPDSFTQSTADSFTQSTADSFTQSTFDSFIQSTADNYTILPNSFTQSTADSFPPTSTRKAYILDPSSGSFSSFSNGTLITTERNKRDGQSIPKEIRPEIEMTNDGGQIQVSWNNLNCTEGYEMDWTCERNYSCCSPSCKKPPENNLECKINFHGEPCTTYTVKVRGKNCNSSWSEKEKIFINCTAPSKPRKLSVTMPAFDKPTQQSRMAHITWNTPSQTNGILKSYRITYHIKNTPAKTLDIPVNKCNKTECSYSLELKPESSYRFEVRAENMETSSQFSPAETFRLTTEAGVPFFRNNMSLNYDKKELSYNSITLLINGSSISNDNGKIRECFVKMKKGCNGKNEKPETVYCTRTPPNEEFKVVIGEVKPTQSDCGTFKTFSSLDSNQCYKFFVLIYTKNHSAESNTVEIHTTQHYLVPVLYGLVVVLIILLLGVVAAYVIFRHLYRPILHSESIELPLVVLPPPDVNVEKRILLSDLLATVQNLFSNGSAGLASEYAEIQALRTFKPCKNAQLPANRIKTRYLNILPFDETRVVLKEYPNIIGSDFINASYVHGYSVAREFIACQGPLANTVADFWRMVWEKNVYVIVMVTQCFERNKEKCCKYWPDKGRAFSFGDLALKVRNLQEQQHQEDGYIQRNLQLSKIHKMRSISHFQFESWPDMGCPDTPDQLIKFVKAVKEAVPAQSAHVVVHCSAGVGRTGTFIGLSNLIEEMHEQDSIDVFHAVYRMRLYRTNMVQTQVQYSFLYKCVLKYYLDQKGKSESWSTIERRLDNPEAIPDVINGALRGPQHDKSDEGNITCSRAKENITQ
ncbi:receptor-type tyrosine-protein phosphatase H-like isoform X2 [Portunus trituberculatus]|uniref:receptor-type tyrosine-protein phosphatase H-like isoform X2 n=1 Tax=Portunus trituberculatus TaxID=210409 RepID=UPI001E1CF281|nr:receptor-type tyrosine-protein phosphatase H-like isoform X2 [Portunus trituberculatus]